MTVTISDMRRRTDGLMLADRRRFRRRLSGADRIAHRDRRVQVLETIARDLGAAEQLVVQRRASVPSDIGYPGELPIAEHLADLKAAIADHQVVIVAGETGSGKSTQLPKLCLELGRGVTGHIGHTQPRRIAARAIAGRVAEELNSAIGGLVGFKIRFSDQVGDTTLVKVMTDGILLSEIQGDRLLLAYDTIIVDEAHERSLNIDFLIGYLKRLLPKRPDLKVIITSATIDTERFSEHFDDAPVLEVSGRTYPVDMRYRPLDDPSQPEPRDQAEAICDAVRELAAEGPGDILVFCSGEREIRDASDALRDLRLPDTEVVPLFARLSTAEQQRIFHPHQGRRIVVATNVAETSLTVPGIRAVVDTGVARVSRFSRRTKVQRLPIEPISQASANQRAGRCGRLGPGICIRLFSEDDFNGRPEFTDPEVKRTNLASVILQMAAIGLGDIAMFPFLEPPDSRAIRDGITLLEELGAARPDRRDTSRWITDVGRTLARIPLDPRLARMVIEADRRGCLREVLVIAAALSIQDPRERPIGLESKADGLHARFNDDNSDLITWLNLWSYLRSEKRARSSSQFRRLCRDEFLSYRRIREWQDVYGQLREVAGDLEMTLNRRPADHEQVHLALLSGLLSHVGRKDPEGYEYQGARGMKFSIAPGSVLFKRTPDWVMAADLVETTRTWARGLAPMTPDVIESLAGHQVNRSHSDPWWDAKAGAAVATETVTLYGLPLVKDRTVQFARIDPGAARELFIRHALVFGEWETHHAFDRRNREAIQQVVDIEIRERRMDLLADDRSIEAFFAERIPDDITTVRHFDRWWKTAKTESPHLLDLTLGDLIDPDARPPDETAFPEVWHHGDVDLPITYEFDTTSPADGVTIDVPLESLDRLDPDLFEWQVPGLRVELIDALIRTLPKKVRKAFVPIPETAAAVADAMAPVDGPLLPALRRELSRRSGEAVALDAFDVEAVPQHLRLRFRLVEEDGTVVAEGDDLRRLRSEAAEAVSERVQAASHEIERSGLTAWTIGALPTQVEVTGEAGSVMAFPALVDDGDSVSVRLFGTRQDQAESMWQGTRRLVLLSLPSPQRLARSLVDDGVVLAVAASPYESVREFTADCLDAAVDRTLEEHGGVAWDGVAFDRLLSSVRDGLYDALVEVVDTAGSVLSALRSVYVRMDELVSPKFEAALDDVQVQLARMIFPGFISAFGASRLPDIARYVLAIEHRLDRLPDNLVRDADQMLRVQALEAEHDGLLDSLPPSDKLADIGWMLQELRVGLFAQALGTKRSVSEKRLRQALADVAITG